MTRHCRAYSYRFRCTGPGISLDCGQLSDSILSLRLAIAISYHSVSYVLSHSVYRYPIPAMCTVSLQKLSHARPLEAHVRVLTTYGHAKLRCQAPESSTPRANRGLLGDCVCELRGAEELTSSKRCPSTQTPVLYSSCKKADACR